MRPRHVLLALVGATATSAPALALPHHPSTPGADYVVTLRATRASEPRAVSRSTVVIHHHGDWSVEQLFGEGTTMFHVNHVTGIVVSDLRDRNGARTLVLRLDALRAAEPTGLSRDIAGETCGVVELSSSGGRGRKDVTCVTEDGIELARGSVLAEARYDWHYEATQVERRPVSPSEVEPPQDALDLAAWVRGMLTQTGDRPRQSTSVEPNVELVLSASGKTSEASGGGTGFLAETARVQRRYGDWLYRNSTYVSGARNWTIENRSLGLHARLTVKPDGTPDRSFFQKTQPGGDAAPFRDKALKEQGSMTTPYGPCQWFVYPGLPFFEVRPSECRRADELILEETANGRTLSAVSERKYALVFSDVLPPRTVLDEQPWDLMLPAKPVDPSTVP